MNATVPALSRQASTEEVLVVNYRNDEHKRWHVMLTSKGFSFTVDSFVICLTYIHMAKDVTVILEESGEEPPAQYYDPKVLLRRNMPDGRKEQFIPLHDFYTEAEFQWVFHDNDIDSFEALDRELHILLKVRPNTMNAGTPRI
jgi:hypothetical protein